MDEALGQEDQVKVSYNRLLVYHRTFMKSISFHEISVCIFEDRVTKVITVNGEIYSTSKSMNDIEEKLPQGDFFRISRHCIIAYKSIARIEPYFGNRLIIFTSCNLHSRAVVSRPRVSSFKSWLGD